MSSRKVWSGGAWVDIGGGAAPSVSTPPFPGPILPDTISTGLTGVTNVTVTGSASPDNLTTPGPWAEVVPTLSAPSGGMVLVFTGGSFVSNTDSACVVEVGVGPDGGEVVVAAVLAGCQLQGAVLTVPGLIPAGSRVALRIRAHVQAAKTFSLSCSFLPDEGLSGAVSYGANPATAKGVLLSATPAVPSTWGVLSAATSAPIDVVALYAQTGGDITMQAGGAQVEVAVGPNGAEVVLAVVALNLGNDETVRWASPQTVSVPTIPAGSRLAVRFRTGNAGNSTLDVAIVGAALT